MGKIAFVFAGQGAQYPGMGQELAQCSPAAAEIFAKLDALRPGTSAQCFGGTDEELKETKNTQPCMFAVELAAAAALYHDAPEILTGDLPTPIKYYNPAIRDAYKQVEHIACGKLVGMLPPELQPDFAEALTPTDPEVEELVKAADKLSAHIKCLEELKAGNLEFRRAAEQTEQALDDFHLPELTYFREHFLPSFRLTLDEME